MVAILIIIVVVVLGGFIAIKYFDWKKKQWVADVKVCIEI